MTIEQEIRFYFSSEKLMFWREKLRKFEYRGQYYELTVMYDNPNPAYTFYAPSIDGRLRLRVANPIGKDLDITKRRGLVSWKQRIPEFQNEKIRHENEIEFNFNPSELQAVQIILEMVLKCPKISSYERRRSHYEGDEIHITLDEFPFGLMLEFEAGGNVKDAKERLTRMITQFGLNFQQASIYSCDDMYRALCLEKKSSRSRIYYLTILICLVCRLIKFNNFFTVI